MPPAGNADWRLNIGRANGWPAGGLTRKCGRLSTRPNGPAGPTGPTPVVMPSITQRNALGPVCTFTVGGRQMQIEPVDWPPMQLMVGGVWLVWATRCAGFVEDVG